MFCDARLVAMRSSESRAGLSVNSLSRGSSCPAGVTDLGRRVLLNTVRGPIELDAMGRTLMREHVFVVLFRAGEADRT